MIESIKNVLILDDCQEDRATYERYLQQICLAGPKIFAYDRGRTALEFIKHQDIDCILLDYQLPDMTGVDFLKEVKASLKRTIPVIFLTGEGSEKVAVQVLKLGANDYLLKNDVTPSVLRDSLIHAFKTVTHENEIAYLGYHDSLTGLFNRHYFEEQAHNVLSHVKRYHRKMAVIMMDVDNFKPINDNNGHAVGDEVLKLVAKRLDSVIRRSDLLARIGGDEFVVLIDVLQSDNDLLYIAEKLRTVIDKPYEVNGSQYQVTLSLGAAVFPDHGKTLEVLLKHADNALYQAKAKGKNQYLLYTN